MQQRGMHAFEVERRARRMAERAETELDVMRKDGAGAGAPVSRRGALRLAVIGVLGAALAATPLVAEGRERPRRQNRVVRPQGYRHG